MFKLGDGDIVIQHLIAFFIFYWANYFLLANNQYEIGSGYEDAFFDAAYITLTTHTTTGYGDITPKTKWAKLVLMLHQLAVYILTLEVIALAAFD